jgi:hypothetical protein
LGQVLLRRGKQNIGAGAFGRSPTGSWTKVAYDQQGPSPLPCPLCAGALLIMAKVLRQLLQTTVCGHLIDL